MKYGNLILEKKEYVYLKRMLNISGYEVNHEIQKSLMKFGEELKNAHILDEEEMPDDVVRLNSTVTVGTGDDWVKTITIVVPADKDIKNNKISVHTPMGVALFGYSVSDVVKWEFPNGTKELTIIAVEQEVGVRDLNNLI